VRDAFNQIEKSALQHGVINGLLVEPFVDGWFLLYRGVWVRTPNVAWDSERGSWYRS